MRKRFIIFITIILLLAPVVIVKADVIWGNEFEHKNVHKIRELRQIFTLNGESGSVCIRMEPSSDSEIFYELENGQIISINGTYLSNGEYWGIMQSGHYYTLPGWILMDELLTYYSNDDFVAEHQEEFFLIDSRSYEYQFDNFYIWKWPGSDQEKVYYSTEEDGSYSGSYNLNYTYKDDDGRLWLQTYTYWDSIFSNLIFDNTGWICISDPDNDQIPAFHPAPEPQKWVPDNSYTRDFYRDDFYRINSIITILIIVLVMILVVGTTVLIRVLRK